MSRSPSVKLTGLVVAGIGTVSFHIEQNNIITIYNIILELK
jgi:hypothetical protein